MTNAPDFRNGAISQGWRAAIEQLGHPAHMAPGEWAKVIELAHEAAIAALSTFYRIATSSRDVEVSVNAIVNGGELTKLMVGNLQESMVQFCKMEGGGTRTFVPDLGPIEAKGDTVQ